MFSTSVSDLSSDLIKLLPWLVIGFLLPPAIAQDVVGEKISCSTLEFEGVALTDAGTSNAVNASPIPQQDSNQNEPTDTLRFSTPLLDLCLIPDWGDQGLFEACVPVDTIASSSANASSDRTEGDWSIPALDNFPTHTVACVEDIKVSSSSEPQEATHQDQPTPHHETISEELLPQIEAPDFTVTAIRQQAKIKNRSNRRATEYQGQLTALGTILGGSWFIQTKQPDLKSEQSWQLSQAQYLRQTKFADYIVGSQPSFWAAEKNDYWGMTAIRRWGFKSPQTQAGFDPSRRLQVGSSKRPEQLPEGASALIVSGGAEREFLANGNFFGKLREFQGGVGYRYGMTDTLTLGTGIVADGSVKGLAELLFGPSDAVQLELSALSNPLDGGVDINSRVRLSSLTVDLDYDSDRQRGEFEADWQLAPDFSLMASGTLDELTTGFRYAHRSPDFSTTVKAELDGEGYLLWQLKSRWDQFDFSSRRSQKNSQSELSYNLSGSGNSGHFLHFNYKTRSSKRREDDLFTVGWRYRSQERSSNQRLWEVELGYATGSQGSGFSAAAATAIVPGLGVKVGYQQISVASDEPSFNLELVPNFDLSGTSEDRLERLRQQGSLWIQPFIDRNRNGRWDAKEKIYTETDWLLLEGQPIGEHNFDTQEKGIFVKLFPATYRLELEPSQLPAGWTVGVPAYEVEVVAGSYTSVLIPIEPATD